LITVRRGNLDDAGTARARAIEAYLVGLTLLLEALDPAEPGSEQR